LEFVTPEPFRPPEGESELAFFDLIRAYVTKDPNIGQDEDGREIDVLFGAIAIQVVRSVDNPAHVPPDVTLLIREMDRELKAIQAEELAGVMNTYVGVALFLVFVWFVIRAVRMPVASETVEGDGVISGFRRLAKNKNYVRGVVAQFFYVGAQIGVWSFTILYVMVELDLKESDASDYYLAALILFALSRFLFTALMKFFKPSLLLALSSLLGANRRRPTSLSA
jgi:hypothetical protein